ncbi:MAG: 4-hydroxy-tetrahydrodipicolinate synthase [bacterium]|nr:4-hydroxy-tetrahydrodipicolinate synthase [bacterium]
MFEGSIVAIVTPFKDDKIDEQRLSELIEFHISEGTSAILPCGCTGEAATLTHKEQEYMIKLVIDIVNKRVPVIAGTGSNSTEEALALTRSAKGAGADGALLITPYYNKPTPGGQYLHYEKIAKAVDIPIILYNVPSRTGISILPQTVAELSKIDNIIGIKEASGSLDQVSDIINLCDITVLSGDDALTLPMMALGAKGVISVAANVVPKHVARMVKSFLNGNLEESRKIHFNLFPLFKALFYETNPIPVKTALGMMGKISPQLRLPLCEMKKENAERLRGVLIDIGVLS